MSASCATADPPAERGRMIASIRAAARDVPILRDDPLFVAAVAADSPR